MVDLSKYHKIHCLGIGGIGLSAVAMILAEQGYDVSGTDIRESEVTEALVSAGITVYYEHNPGHIDACDAIIYSAAVSSENPEYIRAIELGIPIFSRAQVLGMLMDSYKNSIAICGTHGKTTVTSMTSLILRNAEFKPTILVGGNLPEIHGNVEIGANEYFVTEACEYMDSFLELKPNVGVILNIDSDHLDYFKDIDHIANSFRRFADQIPRDGVLIAYGDNPFVKEILKDRNNKLSYGYSENNDFYADNIIFDSQGFPSFDICRQGKKISHIYLSVPGEHNVLNAMAAFVTALFLKVDIPTIETTLHEFSGTNRRFDFIGTTSSGAKVVDDYAHHPTEIKATINAALNVEHNKLWLTFQPHTYTRTKALFDEFVDAFAGVDVLVLADIYAAREQDIYNVSSQKLAEAIKSKHPETMVYYGQSFEDISGLFDKFAGSDDLVITMGAGDIYKVSEMLVSER